MQNIDEARLLIKMAMKDLNALINMTDEQAFADEIFGFHVQQAAEKSLKSWLCVLEKSYARTHDLSHLLYLLESEGIDAEPFASLIEFNAFAVQYRYEAYDMEDELLDREECIQKVSRLVNHVEQLILNYMDEA